MTEPTVPQAPSAAAEPATEQLPKLEAEFVDELLALPTGERAILKRNAGRTLAESRGCYSFYRLLPRDLRRDFDAEACFLVATLLCGTRNPARARHSTDGFGCAMRRLGQRAGSSSEAVSRRFGILLDARFEPWTEGGGELPFRLRQMIRLADSREVDIPWVTLLRDLRDWNHPRRRVQKRWAAAFFAGAPEPDAPETETETETA